MALAGTVAVGVGMETIFDDDDEESCARVMGSSVAAAARAEANLMETMMSKGRYRASGLGYEMSYRLDQQSRTVDDDECVSGSRRLACWRRTLA
jgi:hypothetical protein